jgi:hypothetical protein
VGRSEHQIGGHHGSGATVGLVVVEIAQPHNCGEGKAVSLSNSGQIVFTYHLEKGLPCGKMAGTEKQEEDKGAD